MQPLGTVYLSVHQSTAESHSTAVPVQFFIDAIHPCQWLAVLFNLCSGRRNWKRTTKPHSLADGSGVFWMLSQNFKPSLSSPTLRRSISNLTCTDFNSISPERKTRKMTRESAKITVEMLQNLSIQAFQFCRFWGDFHLHLVISADDSSMHESSSLLHPAFAEASSMRSIALSGRKRSEM